jgi:N6-adenosine-specific RNA methylase IME4/DNA-binding Lrp family transcriptional regulator
MTELSVSEIPIAAIDLFQVMPPLSADEYTELKTDIAARGVMVPIEYDETGNILDGHHRVKACQELGIKEWPSVVRLGLDEAGKRTHARKLNMARRHLNQEQRRSLVQAELKDRPEVSDRQIAKALGVSNPTVSAVRKELVENGELLNFNSSIGADGKERPRAVTRREPEPELLAPWQFAEIASAKEYQRQLLGGELEIPVVPARPISIAVANPSQVNRTAEKATAVLTAAQDNPALSRVVDQMERSGKVNAAHRQVMKIQAAEAINAEPLPMPQGPFRIIVADPPWLYGARADDFTHQVANPYPSMSIEEICALPVADFAHDDCILWLWTTNAHMRESYAVLDAWGFQPKTILTWVKDRIGTGDWLRGQTEHCHLAIRGRPTILTTGHSTVIQGPLQAHSQKPDSFYTLVESICPGSKLEMFSRSPREGWAAWGNEAKVQNND